MSDDSEHLKIARMLKRYQIAMIAVFGAVVVAILRYGVLPIAKAIAGTDTSFVFDFGLSISLAFNVALTVGLGFSEVGRRRALKSIENQEARRPRPSPPSA